MDIYVIHWRWFFELCSRNCDWSKLCHCHFFGPINRIYVKIPMTTSVHYLSFLYILYILYFKWSNILDHFSTFQNMCKYMYHIFTESKVIEDMWNSFQNAIFVIACFVVQMYEYLFLENKSKDIYKNRELLLIYFLYYLVYIECIYTCTSFHTY